MSMASVRLPPVRMASVKLSPLIMASVRLPPVSMASMSLPPVNMASGEVVLVCIFQFLKFYMLLYPLRENNIVYPITVFWKGGIIVI